MQRTRRIAGTPVRSAADAWTTVKALLSDTLERSSEIPDGSVTTALVPLDGLASAIAASGAAADAPFTVIAGDLHLDIYIVRGDDAFSVEENLVPVPGGSSAPSTWLLYIQPPAHLRDTLTAVVDGAQHLKVGKPLTTEAKSQIAAGTAPVLTINESALRRLGGSR
jgi:hypothetical protein